MPKVVHVAQYYAPHGGGVESHLVQLNKLLIDRGYQVSVIASQHDQQLPLTEGMDGVTVHRLPVGSTVSSAFSYKLNMWFEIVRRINVLRNADIIQVHDVMWWLLPVWPLIAHKVFMIFHGWEGIFPIPWHVKLQRWVWAKLAKKTIHVGTYLQQFYWDKPDRIIFGAVDKKFIVEPSHRQHGKGHKFVYIGRLVAENELEKYVELAAQLQKKLPDGEVLWLGDGPYKEACAKVGKTVGFVSDVLPYLDDADVVFATSYLSTMQAQARGKIVCALYSHPLKKATLTTFPTADSMLISDEVPTMVSLIEKIIDEPVLKQSHEHRAQQWARQQTWQHIADEYEKLWGMYG
jgi:glycosyltransferase involved in cell wall biosynthesis